MPSYHLNFPLAETSRLEEAGGMGMGMPLMRMPKLKNYADHPELRKYVEQELYWVMDWTRKDRRGLEQEWEEIRNMNTMKHDAGRRYFGRSDVYLPVYKRERKKLINTLSRGLFPSDDYFDVVDLSSSDPESAKPVKAYMQWELETNARIRSYMKPFLGQRVDYGTSVLKHWYKKDLAYQGGARQSRIGNILASEYGFQGVKNEGLAISPRNLMYWFVYPITAESLKDALMTFEDIDVPYSYALDMKRRNRWKNVDEVLGFWSQPEHDRAVTEMLSSRGLGQQPGRGETGEFGQILTFTEVWTHMVLPDKDAYVEGEDPRLPVPVRVVMSWNVPVEITRNPFFHQQPPYEVTRVDWEPGCFYGNAEGRLIRPLQLLSNDFMNQTNDNGILALNPIVIIDPTKMVGPPKPFAPGVPWYVLDVDKAVRFERPPMEQVPLGLQMTQLAIGMAQDNAGAPPDRSAMGKGAKTATGMSILQKNAMIPLQDDVEDIEGDVMVPILKKGWKNAIQYRDREVMVKIAGGQPIQVTPEMLAIDADFEYKASSQASNNQVRSQQAMQLIQGVAPIVPLLVQQGYIVDFVTLIRKVFVDGMGFRGFNEFIRKAQAVPGAMPGQLAPPEQRGGAQGEQQDNLRSALDQLGGGQQEMVPGEGEDFTQVRNEADQMAGMMGGSNGGAPGGMF